MFLAYVVNRGGDFIALACDEECAEYIVDDLALTEPVPGLLGYTARVFPVSHECAACGDMIHAKTA